MNLHSIINDDALSMKIKDIYKFIEKNDDKFTSIFNRTYEDIKNQYSAATIDNDIIEVTNIDISNINEIRNNFNSILSYHAKNILDENSYLISYAFKLNVFDNVVSITRKR